MENICALVVFQNEFLFGLILSISLLLSFQWLRVVLSPLTVISMLLAVALSEIKDESKCVSPSAGVSHQWSCWRSAGTPVQGFQSPWFPVFLISVLHISSDYSMCSSATKARHRRIAAVMKIFILGVLLTDCTLVPGSLSVCLITWKFPLCMRQELWKVLFRDELIVTSLMEASSV